MLRTGYLLSLLAFLLEQWRKADELLLVQHPTPKESSTSFGESSFMCMFLHFLCLIIYDSSQSFLIPQLSKLNSLLTLHNFSHISQIAWLIIQLSLPQHVHFSATCSTPFNISIKETGFSSFSDFFLQTSAPTSLLFREVPPPFLHHFL